MKCGRGFWARPLADLGLGPLPRAQIQGPRQRFFIFFNFLCRGPLARPSFADGQARPSAKIFFWFFEPSFFVGL